MCPCHVIGKYLLLAILLNNQLFLVGDQTGLVLNSDVFNLKETPKTEDPQKLHFLHFINNAAGVARMDQRNISFYYDRSNHDQRHLFGTVVCSHLVTTKRLLDRTTNQGDPDRSLDRLEYVIVFWECIEPEKCDLIKFRCQVPDNSSFHVLIVIGSIVGLVVLLSILRCLYHFVFDMDKPKSLQDQKNSMINQALQQQMESNQYYKLWLALQQADRLRAIAEQLSTDSCSSRSGHESRSSFGDGDYSTEQTAVVSDQMTGIHSDIMISASRAQQNDVIDSKSDAMPFTSESEQELNRFPSSDLSSNESVQPKGDIQVIQVVQAQIHEQDNPDPQAISDDMQPSNSQPITERSSDPQAITDDMQPSITQPITERSDPLPMPQSKSSSDDSQIYYQPKVVRRKRKLKKRKAVSKKSSIADSDRLVTSAAYSIRTGSQHFAESEHESDLPADVGGGIDANRDLDGASPEKDGGQYSQTETSLRDSQAQGQTPIEHEVSNVVAPQANFSRSLTFVIEEPVPERVTDPDLTSPKCDTDRSFFDSPRQERTTELLESHLSNLSNPDNSDSDDMSYRDATIDQKVVS